MIRFDQGNQRFNFRVVGVAIHNNQILLHQAEGDSFWSLPGGRVEFGEAVEQTLQREMREELDVDVEVVRLLWLVENFFVYDEKNYHELSPYFLMQLPESSKYLTEAGPYRCTEPGSNLVFQWFPNTPEMLAALPLVPSFLQTELQILPETTQHKVHRDE
ncbi:MAG: NUDIX hydrolase [Blastocatellia bacterium]